MERSSFAQPRISIASSSDRKPAADPRWVDGDLGAPPARHFPWRAACQDEKSKTVTWQLRQRIANKPAANEGQASFSSRIYLTPVHGQPKLNRSILPRFAATTLQPLEGAPWKSQNSPPVAHPALPSTRPAPRAIPRDAPFAAGLAFHFAAPGVVRVAASPTATVATAISLNRPSPMPRNSGSNRNISCFFPALHPLLRKGRHSAISAFVRRSRSRATQFITQSGKMRKLENHVAS
jgi:hypothetical protein